jgi:putative transposase
MSCGSIVAVDRGYNDYSWYNHLTERGIFFVTSLTSNTKTRVVERHTVLKERGLTSDYNIEFTGVQTA